MTTVEELSERLRMSLSGRQTASDEDEKRRREEERRRQQHQQQAESTEDAAATVSMLTERLRGSLQARREAEQAEPEPVVAPPELVEGLASSLRARREARSAEPPEPAEAQTTELAERLGSHLREQARLKPPSEDELREFYRETGLHELHNRYLESNDGRWIIEDGDTIIDRETNEVFRTVGFDSPEVPHFRPDAPDFSPYAEAGGERATARMKELLDSGDYEFDRQGVDIYGRTLGEFRRKSDGKLFSEIKVEEGLAMPMEFDGQRNDRVRRAQVRGGMERARSGEVAPMFPQGIVDTQEWAQQHNRERAQRADATAPIEEGIGSVFGRGLQRGGSSVAMLLGSAQEFAGQQLGWERLEERGTRIIAEESEALAANMRVVESFAEVRENPRLLGTYVAEAVAEQVYLSLGLAAAGTLTAGTGFAAGTALVAGQRAGMLLATRTASQRAALAATAKKTISQATLWGARGGAFGAGSVVGVGSMHQELSNAGIDAPLTTLIGGIASGFVNTVGMEVLVRSIMPNAREHAVRGIAQMAGSVAAATGLAGVTELGISAADELIHVAARAYHDPEFDLWTDENLERIGEAAIRGAVSSAVMGGTGRMLTALGEMSSVDPYTVMTPDTLLVDERGADGPLFARVVNRAADGEDRAVTIEFLDGSTKELKAGDWENYRVFSQSAQQELKDNGAWNTAKKEVSSVIDKLRNRGTLHSGDSVSESPLREGAERIKAFSDEITPQRRVPEGAEEILTNALFNQPEGKRTELAVIDELMSEYPDLGREGRDVIRFGHKERDTEIGELLKTLEPITMQRTSLEPDAGGMTAPIEYIRTTTEDGEERVVAQPSEKRFSHFYPALYASMYHVPGKPDSYVLDALHDHFETNVADTQYYTKPDVAKQVRNFLFGDDTIQNPGIEGVKLRNAFSGEDVVGDRQRVRITAALLQQHLVGEDAKVRQRKAAAQLVTEGLHRADGGNRPELVFHGTGDKFLDVSRQGIGANTIGRAWHLVLGEEQYPAPRTEGVKLFATEPTDSVQLTESEALTEVLQSVTKADPTPVESPGLSRQALKAEADITEQHRRRFEIDREARRAEEEKSRTPELLDRDFPDRKLDDDSRGDSAILVRSVPDREVRREVRQAHDELLKAFNAGREERSGLGRGQKGKLKREIKDGEQTKWLFETVAARARKSEDYPAIEVLVSVLSDPNSVQEFGSTDGIAALMQEIQKSGLTQGLQFELVKELGTVKVGDEDRLAMGRFDPQEKKILLNEKVFDPLQRLTRESINVGVESFAHELVHGVVQNKYGRMGVAVRRDLQNIQTAIADFTYSKEGNKAYSELSPGVRERIKYLVDEKNVEEVLTIGLTNPDVQRFLDTIPMGADGTWTLGGEKGTQKTPPTVWSKFVDTIRKILGLSTKHKSALTQVLSVADRVFADRVETTVTQAERQRVKTEIQKAKRVFTEGIRNVEVDSGLSISDEMQQPFLAEIEASVKTAMLKSKGDSDRLIGKIVADSGLSVSEERQQAIREEIQAKALAGIALSPDVLLGQDVVGQLAVIDRAATAERAWREFVDPPERISEPVPKKQRVVEPPSKWAKLDQFIREVIDSARTTVMEPITDIVETGEGGEVTLQDLGRRESAVVVDWKGAARALYEARDAWREKRTLTTARAVDQREMIESLLSPTDAQFLLDIYDDVTSQLTDEAMASWTELRTALARYYDESEVLDILVWGAKDDNLTKLSEEDARLYTELKYRMDQLSVAGVLAREALDKANESYSESAVLAAAEQQSDINIDAVAARLEAISMMMGFYVDPSSPTGQSDILDLMNMQGFEGEDTRTYAYDEANPVIYDQATAQLFTVEGVNVLWRVSDRIGAQWSEHAKLDSPPKNVQTFSSKAAAREQVSHLVGGHGTEHIIVPLVGNVIDGYTTVDDLGGELSTNQFEKAKATYYTVVEIPLSMAESGREVLGARAALRRALYLGARQKGTSMVIPIQMHDARTKQVTPIWVSAPELVRVGESFMEADFDPVHGVKIPFDAREKLDALFAGIASLVTYGEGSAITYQLSPEWNQAFVHYQPSRGRAGTHGRGVTGLRKLLTSKASLILGKDAEGNVQTLSDALAIMEARKKGEEDYFAIKKELDAVLDSIDRVNSVLTDEQKGLFKAIEKITAFSLNLARLTDTDRLREATRLMEYFTHHEQAITTDLLKVAARATSDQPALAVGDLREILLEMAAYYDPIVQKAEVREKIKATEEALRAKGVVFDPDLVASMVIGGLQLRAQIDGQRFENPLLSRMLDTPDARSAKQQLFTRDGAKVRGLLDQVQHLRAMLAETVRDFTDETAPTFDPIMDGDIFGANVQEAYAFQQELAKLTDGADRAEFVNKKMRDMEGRTFLSMETVTVPVYRVAELGADRKRIERELDEIKTKRKGESTKEFQTRIDSQEYKEKVQELEDALDVNARHQVVLGDPLAQSKEVKIRLEIATLEKKKKDESAKEYATRLGSDEHRSQVKALQDRLIELERSRVNDPELVVIRRSAERRIVRQTDEITEKSNAREEVIQAAQRKYAEAVAFRGIKDQAKKYRVSEQIIATDDVPSQIVNYTQGIVKDVLGFITQIQLVGEKGLNSLITEVEKSITETEASIKQYIADNDGGLVRGLSDVLYSQKQDLKELKALQGKKGGIKYHMGDRALIFVSGDEGAIASLEGRREALAVVTHEIGHLIQRLTIDQFKARDIDFVKQLRTELGQGDFNENFANQLLLWAKDRAGGDESGMRSKLTDIVSEFFNELGVRLRRLWRAWKGEDKSPLQRELAPTFAQFIDNIVYRNSDEILANRSIAVSQEMQKALDGVTYTSRVPEAIVQDAVEFYGGKQGVAQLKAQLKSRPSVAWAKRQAKPATEMLGKVWEITASTLATRLRKMPGKAAEYLAASVAIRPGERPDQGMRRTIYSEIEAHMGKFNNQLSDLAGEVSRAPHIGNRMLGQIRGKRRTDQYYADNSRVIRERYGLTQLREMNTEGQYDLAVKYAEYMTSVQAFAADEGVRLSVQDGRAPLVFNTEKMSREPDDFRKFLTQDLGIPDEDAIINPLIEEIYEADGVFIQANRNYYAGVRGSTLLDRIGRLTEADQKEKLAAWLNDDLVHTAKAYTVHLIQRAVTDQRFGKMQAVTQIRPDGTWRIGGKFYRMGKLEQMIDEDLVNHRITSEQANWLQFQVRDAMLGKLGLSKLDPAIKRLYSTTQTYQNVRILAGAVLSSFAEPGLVMMRAGFGNAIQGFRMAASSKTRQDLYRMAETLGIIEDDIADHFLTDSMSTGVFTPAARRFNYKFFRAIRLTQWTNFMRVASMAASRLYFQDRFIDLVEAPGSYKRETALRDLADLGLSEADLQSWSERGWGYGELRIGGQDDRVHAAMQMINKQMTMRPDPSMRPMWGNDARFMPIWYLKSFMWTFNETILRHVWHQAQRQDANFMTRITPALAMVAFTMPLAAVGYELRRLLTGQSESGFAASSDGLDYFHTIAQRAAIYGIGQIAADMDSEASRGGVFAVGALGPSIQQINGWITESTSTSVLKAIPGPSYSWPLRREILEALELR